MEDTHNVTIEVSNCTFENNEALFELDYPSTYKVLLATTTSASRTVSLSTTQDILIRKQWALSLEEVGLR